LGGLSAGPGQNAIGAKYAIGAYHAIWRAFQVQVTVTVTSQLKPKSALKAYDSSSSRCGQVAYSMAQQAKAKARAPRTFRCELTFTVMFVRLQVACTNVHSHPVHRSSYGITANVALELKKFKKKRKKQLKLFASSYQAENQQRKLYYFLLGRGKEYTISLIIASPAW
jgi:hypothetical protein